MDIIELRKNFVLMSGRIDLVTDLTTYGDNGVDFYLRAGQEFLSTLLYTKFFYGKNYININTGDYSFSVKQFTAINDIWCFDGSENKTLLRALPLPTFMANFGMQISMITNGRPITYAINAGRCVLPLTVPVINNYINATDFGATDTDTIIFYPSADKAYTLEVWGQLLDVPLSNDQPTSYTSKRCPYLLLKAALYQLEVFYRNSEGQRDWLSAIMLEAQNLEKGYVEEQSHPTNRRNA